MLYLFLAGILIRMLVEHLDARPASPLRARLSFALFAISAPYLLLGSDWINEGGGCPLKGIVALVLGDVALMAFCLLCAGCPCSEEAPQLEAPGLRGPESYSMFVFHQIVLLFVRRGILREEWFSDWIAQSALLSWVGFLLYFVLVYAVIGFVSYLGFRFIESPFLRLKPK